MAISLHRSDFGRQIYTDGAPGDAPSAPYASTDSELIVPVAEFVREPLSIARFRRLANAAASNMGKIQREAGVPLSPAFCVVARKIRCVFDR